MYRYTLKTAALALIACSAATQATGGGLYQWTDKAGNVHYTDRIPARDVQNGYREMNKQGMTVNTVTREKVKPVVLEPDEATKARIAKDKQLLSTYSGIDEIFSARDRKLEEIKSLIHLKQEASYLLEQQFYDLTKEASDYEKKSIEIPAELSEKIHNTQKKIDNYQTAIAEHEEQLVKAKQQFSDEIARYREISESNPKELAATP